MFDVVVPSLRRCSRSRLALRARCGVCIGPRLARTRSASGQPRAAASGMTNYIRGCQIDLNWSDQCFSREAFERGTSMTEIHPLAGKTVPPSMLANIPRLVTAYFANGPTRQWPRSGWRSARPAIAALRSNDSFNEGHILAISQAICDYRKKQGIDGPLFSASTRTRCRSRRFASALRSAGRQRRRGDDRRGRRTTRRRRRSRTPSSTYNRAAARAWPTASSSRRRTTRPTTAASSTTRRTAARPTPTSRTGSSARQRLSRGRA